MYSNLHVDTLSLTMDFKFQVIIVNRPLYSTEIQYHYFLIATTNKKKNIECLEL